MTKKEFLSEIVFSYKGDLDQLYKFRRDNSGIGSMGSILMTVAFRDDDPKYHFCNVDRVTDGKFYGFKFLFGKKRTYIINLKDLTPVV